MPTTQILQGQTFVLLDGWQYRREPGHWQGWLAERLVEHGARVDYVTLPDPESPSYAPWSSVVASSIATDDPCTVIAHGLSVLLWLRMCGESAVLSGGPLARRAMLVAPPDPAIAKGDIAENFYGRVDATAVARSTVEASLLLFSDDDPYFPRGAGPHLGNALRLPHVHIPAAKHINQASGYGQWPAMLDWCRSGSWPTEPTKIQSAVIEQVQQLFVPDGRRLGVVVAGDVSDLVLSSIDATLRHHSLDPERRRAYLQPRPGDRDVLITDLLEFARHYAHEYSVSVLAAELGADARTKGQLEKEFARANCHVVWAPDSVPSGPA